MRVNVSQMQRVNGVRVRVRVRVLGVVALG